MPRIPGKYDAVCTEIMQRFDAEAVVLLVYGGRLGSGVATIEHPDFNQNIPEMLRWIADQIEEEE